MATITRSMMPDTWMAELLEETIVKSLADQMVLPPQARPKKRAYAGWPAGAEQLHRHFSVVAPRSNPGFSRLRQGFAAVIWKCLAAGDDQVRGMFRFGVQYFSSSNFWCSRLPYLRYGDLSYLSDPGFNHYHTIQARHALAWFALAGELPFKVPAPFLAKIREDFGEDLPWLALADWIEEYGQGERAAELRAAVENSRIKAREATITDTEEAQP